MFFNLLLAEPKAPWTDYIMIIVLLVAIVGMFVWSSISNKKRQKKEQEMVASLKIGDRVTTIGGVCGFVAQINDSENTFVLQTGLDGESFVKFDKAAIYRTAPAEGTVKAQEKAEAEAKKEQEKAE